MDGPTQAKWPDQPRHTGPLHGLHRDAVLVYISHWLIDATGLARRWMGFFHQTDVLFMRIAVDQILHVVVLALLVEFVL